MRAKRKPKFDAKANKIKELERKVMLALNNQRAAVPKKQGFMKPLFKKEADPLSNKANKAMSMTGFSSKDGHQED